MSDRVLMKTEKASSLSSTFGVTEQCTRAHTHTHTHTHATAISLSLLGDNTLECAKTPPPPTMEMGCSEELQKQLLLGVTPLSCLRGSEEAGTAAAQPVRRDRWGGSKALKPDRACFP